MVEQGQEMMWGDVPAGLRRQLASAAPVGWSEMTHIRESSAASRCTRRVSSPVAGRRAIPSTDGAASARRRQE